MHNHHISPRGSAAITKRRPSIPASGDSPLHRRTIEPGGFHLDDIMPAALIRIRSL